MKILHLDLVSGIAGDMTLAAMAALGFSLEKLSQALEGMGLQTTVSTTRVKVGGILCLRLQVESAEQHPPHRAWGDIRRLLENSSLPEGARRRALDIFSRLAEAEGAVHGCPPEEVHFHEIGAIDSLVDIIGVAMALDELAPDLVTASPPEPGNGWVECRHGKLPVPAPATLELLRGLPLRSGNRSGELVTPTGAAILATQVGRFTFWPAMIPERTGYGAGGRDDKDYPNYLRAIFGEALQAESVQWQIEVNLDDMNPQFIEHLMERLFSAGALDVWWQPLVMKKSRPGLMLSLLCEEKDRDQLEQVLFTESTTIGLRRFRLERRRLERITETVETTFGQIRIKVSGESGKVFSASPEYEDCRLAAEKYAVPIKEVHFAALAAWKKSRSG